MRPAALSRLVVVPLLVVVTVASATGVRAVVDGSTAKLRTPKSFAIEGAVTAPLWLGTRRPIRLVLANPSDHPLRVHRVHVRGRVDPAHRALGCRMRSDFRIRQLPRQLRINLPARSTRTLRALGVRTRPKLRLRNDPLRNQDACQGATVSLRYRGWAERP